MILRTVILLFFYIYAVNVVSAVSEATKPTPSSLNNDAEEEQKAYALTTALKELIAVLDDKQSISENMDNILKYSQMIGIIVKEGLNSSKTYHGKKDFKKAAHTFHRELIENDVITVSDGPLFMLLEKHINFISLSIMRNYFDPWKMDKFKDGCRENDWTENFEVLQYSLVLFQDNKECPEDYSSKTLKRMYQNLMKKFFIFSTICETLINGPETAKMTEARRNNFLKIVGNIERNMSLIITEKEKNWSSKDIRKHINKNGYNFHDNSDVAMGINFFFGRNYNEMGYEYYVGVSDATTGFNKSVTYCTTECLHFGNIQNKNIFIFRNKINSNGYQKCDYLKKFNNKTETSNWCNNNKNVFGDLRDLANDIIKNCDISALSIVNDKLNYRKRINLGNIFYKKRFNLDDFFTSENFDFPCFGVVNIAVANYPLGYEYYVGVSDATNGFNKSVTYCTTECLHFGNIQNKNIFILRNKINSNGYQKCKYLKKFNNKTETSNWCNNNKNVFGDLRDLANDIIKNCDISALSIVNDKLNYRKRINLGNIFYKKRFNLDDFFTSENFDFPCFGVVNIAVANYPL